MKIHLTFIFVIVAAFAAFGQGGSTAAAGRVTSEWKFGIALWTFHTVNFQEALAKVDSAGVTYIEPNTFQKAGPALNDSLMNQLSPGGMAKLRKLIDQHRLQAESVYIVGDKTVSSWQKQFEMAKQLGATFVTAEPPLNLWDQIDSLAGIYKMKVAIHEHWRGVSHYWHPDSVLAALKNHPNFGACADLGHWPKSGINPVDALKKLNGHILGVHLKDIAAYNDPNLKDVPVGTGVLDFSAIFQELKRQHFRGPIYVERDAEDKPSNLPSVRQTKKYYDEQLKRLK